MKPELLGETKMSKWFESQMADWHCFGKNIKHFFSDVELLVDEDGNPYIMITNESEPFRLIITDKSIVFEREEIKNRIESVNTYYYDDIYKYKEGWNILIGKLGIIIEVRMPERNELVIKVVGCDNRMEIGIQVPAPAKIYQFKS